MLSTDSVWWGRMQVLPISKADTVATMLPVSKFVDDQYITMLTQRGLVKKTPISEFANIRSNGLRAITLVVSGPTLIRAITTQ